MMKPFVLAVMLSGAAIALGGCATTGGGGGVDVCGGPVSNILDIAKCAQKIANNTCGFLADIGPLAQLVPQFKDPAALASAVCAAVQSVPPLQARRSGKSSQAVVVGGVVVTGQFTR